MFIPHVLFVEKDFEIKKKWMVFLYANGFEAVPVSNTNEALALLRVSRFDLVITAGHLPDGDANNLIQTMKSARSLASLPVLVSGQQFSAEEKSHYQNVGASGTFAFSDEPSVLTSILRKLVNLHQNEARHTQQGISGQLAQTPISELIKHLAVEEGSGVLFIDGVVPMEIHLKQGALVHARHGITVGFKALCRCLLIAEAAYHFKKGQTETEPTIKGELNLLLDKGRSANQKLMANSHKLPNSKHRVRVKTSEIFENTKLKPEARAAIEIIKKYPRIANYLDRLNLPDVLCYEYLITFLERGVIELVTENKPVQIITDSSCDLPFELLQTLGIITLPLKLEAGGEKFSPFRQKEEVGLFQKKVKVLEQSKHVLPDTSAIMQRFEALIPDFDCLVLTTAASQVPLFDTVAKCAETIHKDGFEGRRLLANELSIMNSHTISIGLGLLVNFAAGLASKGLQAEQIEERLLQAMARLHLYFVVNPENSYLVKKGSTPVILGWDGVRISQLAKLGKGDDAIEVLLDEASKRIDSKSKLHLAIADVHNQDTLEKCRTAFENKYAMVRPVMTHISPTFGHILGKGALGLAFFQE